MLYREEVMDLFSVPEDFCLAHCISADFALGKGIAVEFNRRYNMRNLLQQQYPMYRRFFADQDIRGDCIRVGRVLNLITKERFFQKPTLLSMEAALEMMKVLCLRQGITKVAMPMIGAGLDRLYWPDVRNLIQKVFNNTNIEILVCRLR